ncbi:MAG: NACHT domain-containing protein, partial [Cyanobacteria bacterium J06659_2]
MKAQCYAVEIEGFQDLPALALEEVFVPLRIESDQNRFGRTTGPQEIWDFLPQRDQTPEQFPHRRMVILAAPGYGKTTLMRHLTLMFVSHPPANKPQFIPILLQFREIYTLMSIADAIESSDSLDLPELVTRHLSLQPEFKNLQPSKNWFTEQLKQGNCLVMLDGLDEVPKSQRRSVRQWVDWQMRFYERTQFILTSRPHGFELQPDDPSYPIKVNLKLKVLDFNPYQKKDFVEKWYRTVFWRMKWKPLLERSQQTMEGTPLIEEQAKFRSEQEAKEAVGDLVRQIVSSPALNDLARNPLLVTMIASTHRSQAVLPKRRVELYDKIFDLLLGTRPYVKKTALTLTSTENKAILQVLAWHLVNAEITRFSPQQGKNWIAESFQRCVKDQPFTTNQFWGEMADIAGLIVEKRLGYLEFAHQTFQEYLAARHLREIALEGEAKLRANLTNDRWQEVIRFYAALGDATIIIDALLEQPSEYTLSLAKKCMDEGRGVKFETLSKLQKIL